MHHVHTSRFRTRADDTRVAIQPPRAPLVGSMPEPRFLPLEHMPDLTLGPPAELVEATTPSRRAPAVVQFASSCPDDFGFFNRNFSRKSWMPTLEPLSDLDLSKSPALAAMTAIRAREAPVARQGNASNESSRYAMSAELLKRLNITSEEDEEDVADREERSRMSGFDVPTHKERMRRGSSGNVSDLGDTGIFEFDDQ